MLCCPYHVFLSCVSLASSLSKHVLRDAGRHYFGRPVGLLFIIFYKACWGLLEMVSGVLFFFSDRLLAHELIEDPQDMFANWVLTQFSWSRHTGFPLVLLLILFGASKIALAVCLWFRWWWIRPIGLILFSFVAFFGLLYLPTHFSAFGIGGLALDVAIFFYFLLALPSHLSKRSLYE